jgi:hypothetical protein
MLVPVLALRGADPAAWDLPGDLVFLGVLTLGVGIAYEVARRVPERRAYLAGAGLALWTVFLTTWINLAVGIIGSEDDRANLLYAAVLTVAGLGASLVRFRPGGMAKVMAATAGAQLLVFFVAWLSGLGFTGPITIFFASLWMIAAWLFQRAARFRAI